MSDEGPMDGEELSWAAAKLSGLVPTGPEPQGDAAKIEQLQIMVWALEGEVRRLRQALKVLEVNTGAIASSAKANHAFIKATLKGDPVQGRNANEIVGAVRAEE